MRTSIVRDVYIAGAAMTKFGKFPDRTVRALAEQAVRAALADAGVTAEQVDMVFFANAVAGLLTSQEMIRGQVALRYTGLSGVPLVNVENACASSSSAFYLACLAVGSGAAEAALAVGADAQVRVRAADRTGRPAPSPVRGPAGGRSPGRPGPERRRGAGRRQRRRRRHCPFHLESAAASGGREARDQPDPRACEADLPRVLRLTNARARSSALSTSQVTGSRPSRSISGTCAESVRSSTKC
jgi:Thiolase, N-terminal domain